MRALLISTLLLSTPALAGEPGHFDRDEVVAASQAFRGVASASTAALEPRERGLTRTDQALADLDLSLALTRGSLGASHHDLWVARLDERSTRFGQEFETLQGQLTAMSVGFEEAFEAALVRATEGMAADGVPVSECAPKPALLGGIPQPGQASSASSCPGENRSPQVAKRWDADPELKAALAAIDPAAFQDVTLYEDAQPALALGAGSGPMWLHPAALVEQLPEAIELIDAVDRRASEGRERLLEARSEIGADDPDGRKKIVERARGVRGWAEDHKAAVGSTLWSALERLRKKGKKAGWSSVGVCLNPAGWNGCGGEDVTVEVAEVLLADKKLARELAAALEALDRPDVSL